MGQITESFARTMLEQCTKCDALLPADDSEPLNVTCARCGIKGTSETFIVEEGDEWECPACWERLEAKERAAHDNIGEKTT